MSGWINVNDYLPEEKMLVLAVDKFRRIRTRQYYRRGWYDERGLSTMDIVQVEEPITHWMPLPEPPK